MDDSRHVLASQSDGELVRLLVAGDLEAMGEIFDRYYRLVMSVALRILRNPDEAEDLVQVVFTDFYVGAKLFDESKGSLRTWLLQYAYGRSFNRKRSLRSRCHSEHVELEDAEREESKGNAGPASRLNPQDAARLVEQILPHLNAMQRSVIQLAFFEGLKLSEIAARTGESLGNVHHAYYRGIAKLRTFLNGTGKDPVNGSSGREGRTSWLRNNHKAPERLGGEVQIVKTRTF
jgi:RNA polymerase sigma-70 factor, ECF subfamily